MKENLLKEIQRFDDTLDVENAFTPPASWYRDKDFHQLEKKAIFNGWSMGAYSQSLPNEGDYITSIVGTKPYVLIRQEGEFKAFYNVCSHHGTCVARGSGNAKKLVCPYHGWEYSLEGKLKKIPKAGSILNIHQKDLNLKPIPLKVIGNFIFLYFGSSETPEFNSGIEEHLNRRLYKNLNFVKRIEYEIPCNWKVFVDNYLDGGYHVSHMHPDLASDLSLDSYKTNIFDSYSIQSCDSENTGRVEGRSEYTWMFPNLMINRYGKWMDTNLAVPIDENNCKVIFEYFHEEEPVDLEESLRASHQVQLEDMDICQMVQTGLNSEVYDQGVYAPQFEKPMYSFHQKLKEALLKYLS
ncbi:MAG: choline monooxygenase [Bacteriovoracaceae bacterium]|jgi:choline monooxygenase